MTIRLLRAITTLVLLVGFLVAATPKLMAQPIRVLAFDNARFFELVNGEPSGLEWEILNYFSQSRDRPLEIEFIEDFDDLLPKLRAGDGDVVAGNVTITPERQREFDFSSSYFPVRVVLVESRDRRAKSLEGLAGANLAVIKGTTYEELLGTVDGAVFTYAGSEDELLDLVASREVRAIALDSTAALTLLPRYPELHMTLVLTETQDYGFAVPKGSPLAQDLSEHLTQMRNSKIYFRLLEHYLGRKAIDMISTAKD